MINIKKGQILFDNPGIVVCDRSGFYEDGTSILCAMIYAPNEPVCRYEAKYIAYGSVVYNISEPDKLLEEVLKIDKDSLFGKSSAEVILDDELKNMEVIDPLDPEIIDNETASTTPETTSTSTPVVPEGTDEPIVPDVATSTPSDPTPAEPIVPDPVVEEPVVPADPVVETPEPEVAPPTVEEVIPAIENVIEELNDISEVVEQVVDTVSETPNPVQ